MIIILAIFYMVSDRPFVKKVMFKMASLYVNWAFFITRLFKSIIKDE